MHKSLISFYVAYTYILLLLPQLFQYFHRKVLFGIFLVQSTRLMKVVFINLHLTQYKRWMLLSALKSYFLAINLAAFHFIIFKQGPRRNYDASAGSLPLERTPVFANWQEARSRKFTTRWLRLALVRCNISFARFCRWGETGNEETLPQPDEGFRIWNM